MRARLSGFHPFALIAVLATAVVAALAWLAWHYSEEIVRPRLPGPADRGLAVLALDDSTVTLPRTRFTTAGRAWFLEWREGAATLGEVVARDRRTVRRRVHTLAGRLAPGERVDLRVFALGGDPRRSAGLAFHDVEVPAAERACPAWFVPGVRRDWVVLVHGMNAGRAEALRALPPIAAAGYPALVIAYGAGVSDPAVPNRLHHLGAREWRDVEAAIRYARARGARSVLLYGFSMGGSVIDNVMRHSPLAAHVTGIVLDAPVLDWDRVVRHAAKSRGIPQWIATLAQRMVSARIGFDWNAGARPAWFGVPLLLFHGEGDTIVPIEGSATLARALGARVTYVTTPDAGHVQSWNYDPRGYERRLREWLATLDGGGDPRGRTVPRTAP